MSVVAACVLYGLLLCAFAVCSPAALALYWRCRRHPVISKRGAWLTVLSVAFTSLLSVALVLQLLLPFLPATAADSFPCSALYSASFLYPALALLPYGLRAVRVLQLHAAAGGSKSPLLSALSRPAAQLTAVLLCTALCAGAAVCWSVWGGADSRADSLSHTPPSLCLVFSNWRFFAPLCAAAFLPFSLCVLRLAERRQERDALSLCSELCCSWLSFAVLGVAYFVLIALPWTEGEVEAPFPLSSLLIALHGLLLLQGVVLPLLAVSSFNRTHRGSSTAALQPEQAATAAAAAQASDGSKRGPRQSHRAASVAAATTAGSAPEGQKGDDSAVPEGVAAADDGSDPLQQSTSLDGVTVGGGTEGELSVAAAERRPASGSLDVSNVWSLERILLDPAANALLERHAERFLCSELLRCWNTITAHHRQHWRMDDPHSLDAAYASSAAIYSHFIRAGSAQEVNVDSKIRSQLAALFDRPLHAAERRAVMARDLHARKKLSREMERKLQQHQQLRQGAAAAKRGSRWQPQAAAAALRQAGNRPRTTTPSSAISGSPSAGRATQSSLPSIGASQQLRNTVSAIAEEAVQSSDSAAAAPPDNGSNGTGGPIQTGLDEAAAGHEAPAEPAVSDGLSTLQPAGDGALGSAQLVIVAPAASPARSVRSATVQCASSEAGLLSFSQLNGSELLMPDAQLPSASLQSSQSQRFLASVNSSCISQTLQMPLQQYDGPVAPASPSAEQQQPATAPVSSYSSPVRGPLPPLHIAVGPDDFVSRESPPPALPQQQARLSESVSGSSSGGRRPSALHFATAGRPLAAADPGAAVSAGEVDDADEAAGAGQRRERAGSHTVPVTPSRSSSSSSSGSSSSSRFSSSTPFPLSALEVAALSSHLIWQRCQHEVRKLIDTNLYLSFIRESADFRRYRLAKRKEERQRQAEARARQKAEEAEAEAALRLASIQLQVRVDEGEEDTHNPQPEGQPPAASVDRL